MLFIHYQLCFSSSSKLHVALFINRQGLLNKQHICHSVLRTQTTTAVLKKNVKLYVWPEISAFCL